jgi:glycosyltransferase involved in cell wall biosynthesis
MNGKRQVAVLISDMNKAGGIQQVGANLVRDLRPHYDTTLLSVEPLAAPFFYGSGLNFRSLNLVRRAWTYPGRLRELVRGGWRLRRFVVENRVDTVLTLQHNWTLMAAIALPKYVKKVGYEHIGFFEPTPKMRLLRARSYWRLDAVVSLAQHDVPHLSAIARSVHVIPIYSLATDPPPPDREKILLTIGHLDSHKGIDRLLWELKEPLLENPDWKLVVVGGGEKAHVDWNYLGYVSKLLQILQLEGKVEFHPATSRIDEWYRRASIYVSGSRYEDLPMMLIEAKANGLPIVSFDCPAGPREIIRPDLDGFLIGNDGRTFTEAASALMTNADLLRKMGEAARNDHEQRFSVGTVIPKWYDLIEKLHQNQPVGARLETRACRKKA